MVVVLSEDSFVDPNTINGRELRSIVEAARMFGCRIYPIPLDFDQCETAENALAYLPVFDAPVIGIWAGYIPSVERYTAIFDAAAAKGVYLINAPSQYQTAMEFDKFYGLLGELTPDSVIVSNLDDLQTIEAHLQLPSLSEARSNPTRTRDGLHASRATVTNWWRLRRGCWLANVAHGAKSSRGVSSNSVRLPLTGSRSRSAASIVPLSTAVSC